ncbi:hypothetical protein M422DRAFT_249863 [Sphaerobolus stellatus SS14]|uniref:Uncharacterized protein n=1 Tax=Sphaerobolus stellatus (strain SS14) TaxID=990650 RepID=A0A0C9W4V5_SPHS4|nr:hypothetical protein M422DRAFT_249863 [Sphaerobolus stellatus SS14]
MRNIQIAIVSRNTNKALALWYFKARDPNTKQFRPITDFVDYDEVKDGVTFKLVAHTQHTLNWDLFLDGLAEWRRNQHMMVPNPRMLDPHPNKMLIGYAGTDRKTAAEYAKGHRRHPSGRPARWGYGLYVADNPQVAMFFSQWLRTGGGGNFHVCEIYARDKDVFINEVNKIWFHPDGKFMTNNWDPKTTEAHIAASQTNRDAHMKKSSNVEKPYILFSRHGYMSDMGKPQYQLNINPKKRFNEMVLYPQIQDHLLYGVDHSLAQARKTVRTGKLKKLQFEHNISQWKIKVPQSTKADCEKHGERNFFK